VTFKQDGHPISQLGQPLEEALVAGQRHTNCCGTRQIAMVAGEIVETISYAI
jgi:hypothetical protein